MVIHFNNRQVAIFHLAANGWKQLKNGRFLSRDRSCIAQIAMTFDEIVAVQILESEMTPFEKMVLTDFLTSLALTAVLAAVIGWAVF